MVQVVQEVDSQEFWENIVGSSWDTWSWWVAVKCDFYDYTKGLTVTVFSPESDERNWSYDPDPSDLVTKHLTVDDLARSYAWYQSAYPRPYKWDNTDAESGDVIIQHAIFGEVIYG